MKTFNFAFTATAEAVKAIFPIISEFEDFSMTEAGEKAARSYTRASPAREAALVYVKGLSAGDPVTVESLAKVLAAAGMNENSASPTLSWLKEQGFVKHTGRKKYEATGKKRNRRRSK